MRDIEPGEEMLLYAREAVFPEPQIAESSESIHGKLDPCVMMFLVVVVVVVVVVVCWSADI